MSTSFALVVNAGSLTSRPANDSYKLLANFSSASMTYFLGLFVLRYARMANTAAMMDATNITLIPIHLIIRTGSIWTKQNHSSSSSVTALLISSAMTLSACLLRVPGSTKLIRTELSKGLRSSLLDPPLMGL